MDENRRILLDLNADRDNALAVLLAVRSRRFTVEGITSVFGSCSAEQAARQTLQILELADPSGEIPVAAGARTPLFRGWQPTGESLDFGALSLPETKRKPINASAADLIVERLNRYPGQITLICLGPLTNVALALVQDPAIADKAKRLVLLGGALKVPGDVTPVSERNIWSDPEAAFRVFRSGIPITLLGLDVSREACLPPECLRPSAEPSAANRGEAANFMDNLVRTRMETQAIGPAPGIPAGGAFALAAAADSGVIETEAFSVSIEIKGTLSRGATLVDLRKGLRPPVNNCDAGMKVNRKRLNDILRDLWRQSAEGGAQ